MTYDLLIRNGLLVDGTGGPPRIGSIAVRGDRIVAVGDVAGDAREVIEAEGLIVTPGWIDIHTHYDGQATWDPLLEPSYSSGVTTAFLGNCGVGFAPVRPGEQDRLIELMEGVEQIPEPALRAGMDWRWTSFEDYLDVLGGMERSFDIGALMPHGPLRLFVLGDRVGEEKCAEGEDLAEMTRLLDRAMAAGAFGLSTSRTRSHRTSTGDMTPDFHVAKPELRALSRVIERHGGILEAAPEGATGDDVDALRREMDLYEELVEETGVAFHFLLVQTRTDIGFWRRQLEWAERMNAAGGEVYGLVGGRSMGAFVGFFGSNPFMDNPTVLHIKRAFPREQWLGELRKPEVRAQILSEEPPPLSSGAYFSSCWDHYYDQTTGIDFEPAEDRKLVHIAAQRGLSVQELAYDLMVSPGQSPKLMATVANYEGGSFENLGELLRRPGSLLSLSDAGAHVMTICDGMLHTFMLTHWVRDRTRGPRMPLEEAVRLMTSDAARAFRLDDRGILAPGLKADINVIDLDKLTLQEPRYVDDLPGDATRLLQAASGYRATIVSGVVTREHDKPTGRLPGRLVRHGGRPRRAAAT